MPQITIETTLEEQNKVLSAIKELGNITVSMRHIAETAGLKESRARYAVMDLLEAGKIAREPSKAYNVHYVRYSYKIL